jgi:hypothetical protein
MCLNVSLSRKPAPEGEGWKVFGIRFDLEGRPHLTGVYYAHDPISLTNWNKADVSKKIGGGLYYAGYHVFKIEEAAKKMLLDFAKYRVMLRVRYRGAHTEGTLWLESKVPDSVVTEEFQIIEGQKLTWRKIEIV